MSASAVDIRKEWWFYLFLSSPFIVYDGGGLMLSGICFFTILCDVSWRMFLFNIESLPFGAWGSVFHILVYQDFLLRMDVEFYQTSSHTHDTIFVLLLDSHPVVNSVVVSPNVTGLIPGSSAHHFMWTCSYSSVFNLLASYLTMCFYFVISVLLFYPCQNFLSRKCWPHKAVWKVFSSASWDCQWKIAITFALKVLWTFSAQVSGSGVGGFRVQIPYL